MPALRAVSATTCPSEGRNALLAAPPGHTGDGDPKSQPPAPGQTAGAGRTTSPEGKTLPMDGDPRLQALVDEGAIDELLNIVSLDQVTETRLRYNSRPSHPKQPDDDPDWWAVELCSHLLGGRTSAG